MLTAERVVELLGLIPLPVEGGHFLQTWCAEETIPSAALPARYGGPKAFGTAIYYLLTEDPDSFSALHRLPSDEVYHFYLGDPVELLMLRPDGSSQRVLLGPDLDSGQCVQHVVPRDVWQGSRLRDGGRFALMGTTMAPGYDERDYTGGSREELLIRFPAEAESIHRLTRPTPAG